jgi:alkylation response protein AidB-like acyl-CoA dehydrogenase
MITEPGFGSDALNMQTSFTEQEGGYHLKGLKHWGGLTGWADFWLLTARRQEPDGQLGFDVELFICDVNQPGQKIVVEELFPNLGLYMIPYGRNRIDVTVPKENRLKPLDSGLKMFADLLNRSRLHFPGMAIGFLRRMLDEALRHCQERHVGGFSLFHYDQVKSRLARLQAAFTACSAMCLHSSAHCGIEKDLAMDSLLPNAIKAVVTDLMQESAQSLLQLVGAKGYRLDHIAGRAIVDSRPFQIFEGANDILYKQIGESVLRQMRLKGESNLFQYLRSYEGTARACEPFKDSLNLGVDFKMPQRKVVALGLVVSRLCSMELTLRLGERGFRKELIDGCLQVFREDVDQLLTSYRSADRPLPVVEYGEGASWLRCLDPAV